MLGGVDGSTSRAKVSCTENCLCGGGGTRKDLFGCDRDGGVTDRGSGGACCCCEFCTPAWCIPTASKALCKSSAEAPLPVDELGIFDAVITCGSFCADKAAFCGEYVGWSRTPCTPSTWLPRFGKNDPYSKIL
jgi:hypothetical protein